MIYTCLFSLREKDIDKVILKEAIINTSKSRKTNELINRSYSIIEKILLNNEIQELWLKYTLKFNYAKGIGFLEVMKSIIKIYDIVK